MTHILRGDQALGYGALAAGVQLVTGYPGSPATGVFDYLASEANSEQITATWSPNEKVALEVAFGASLAGHRSLVVLKSVGMNLALDPLATMSHAVCHAGLVIALGDDPGAWGSQNEQDSRWAARIAEVPIVEPCSVAQAPALMAQAFAWSERHDVPVIVRFTRAFTSSSETVEEPWQLPPYMPMHCPFSNRWIVLPALVGNRRRTLHRHLHELEEAFDASPFDLASGTGDLGIVGVGYAHSKLIELVGESASRWQTLALSSVWPLPEKSLLTWLRQLRSVLVLEECGPFVEEGLRELAQRHGLAIQIMGRHDRSIPSEGELDTAAIIAALGRFDPDAATPGQPTSTSQMPSTQPLCDDCPYVPAFETLLDVMQSLGGRHAYRVVGEPGCMVRAQQTMDLLDVKFSLGSGIGLGLGLATADTRHVVTLVGDSSFWHSGINALPHAIQMGLPMTILIMDNGTTALTGGQPHPGSDYNSRGNDQQPLELGSLVQSMGITPSICSACDRQGLTTVLQDSLASYDLRIIIVQGECPRYTRDA